MTDYDNFFISCVVLFMVFSNLLFILFQKRKQIPSGKFKVILFNFLGSLYLIFFVFMIGESYYRFFVDRTDSFSISKLSSRWLERHYQMNKLEYRDNIDYQSQIEPGKYRISFFGDSFTAGHGIENVNDRFSNILRNKYPNLEVHNFSTNGANTRGNYQRLSDLKASGYQFNIIILSYCMNDIDYLVDNAAKIYKRIHNFSSNQSYLVKQSYFINNLAFRIFAALDPDVKNYNDFLLDAYQGETLQKHLQELNKIVEFANEINVPLMVVTFPFLHTNYEDYQFKPAHQKLDQFWKSNNILHLDLTNTYKKYMGDQLTVNPYDAHPNEFAHKLAADAIDEFFRKSPQKSN